MCLLFFNRSPRTEHKCAFCLFFHSVFPLTIFPFDSVCDERGGWANICTHTCFNLIGLQCFTHPLVWYTFNANVKKQWKLHEYRNNKFSIHSLKKKIKKKVCYCLAYQMPTYNQNAYLLTTKMKNQNGFRFIFKMILLIEAWKKNEWYENFWKIFFQKPKSINCFFYHNLTWKFDVKILNIRNNLIKLSCIHFLIDLFAWIVTIKIFIICCK